MLEQPISDREVKLDVVIAFVLFCVNAVQVWKDVRDPEMQILALVYGFGLAVVFFFLYLFGLSFCKWLRKKLHF